MSFCSSIVNSSIVIRIIVTKTHSTSYIIFDIFAGVSDVVYTCMSELLELHDDRQPGRAKVLASNMLDALVTSAAWTSKSTYPPLGLAISFVGANEVGLIVTGVLGMSESKFLLNETD